MAITIADLKFFQSERMTDNADGGGQMTANEILNGADNAIFDDLSDVDRAAGDVSIRKIYAAVTSPDTDKYLDAGVVLFREPSDPAVSVLACSTGDFYDEREAIKSQLEQTISRGARWNGWLWGQHLSGQRALVIWQRPEAELPSVGARLEVVARAGGADQYSQFLWVTRVTDELRTQYDEHGTYSIRSVTCELAEPLGDSYAGLEPSRVDPNPGTQTALLYDTRYNAEAVPLLGIRPTIAAAKVGDFSIQIDDLYSPVIPTAFAETALPDVTPGADNAALVAGRSTGSVTFTTATQCVKPDASLFLGSACLPGTLSISVSGSTLTDDNGAIKLSGAVVGSVNYAQGVAAFNSACANFGTASKSVTFRPAAVPLRIADTASQAVTAENRGFVWVLTLAPIPAPGTLRVSYRVNNAWYSVSDQGGGTLAGADSAYGSGRLDFGTGTVTLTTGALPDVDSEIIYAWGTPVSYTARGGDAVDGPAIRGTATHAGIAPGTVSVTWTLGQTTYTLDDAPAANGLLTGTGGSGAINYSTGEWWVRPTTLPPAGQDFALSYDWGTPVEETFPQPARDGNGAITLELDNSNVLPGSVEVEFNLIIEAYDPIYSETWEMVVPPTHPVDPTQIVRDDGAGGIELSSVGGTDGTINYSAGSLTFIPDVTLSVPQAVYGQVPMGTRQESGSGGSVYEVTTYRTLFQHWEYIPSGAFLPLDETGWVKVRYRVTGGNTSATETVTLDTLQLDLTRNYAEKIARNSARFKIGTDVFCDTNGQIYRNPAPDTGAGTLAGTLDPSTGRCFISAWTGGITNAVTLESLVTEVGGQPVEEVVFRTPVSPIKSGTLQLRFNLLDGTAKSKTVGGTGSLEDPDCKIRVDYPLGIVRARFGLWKKDADLSPAEKLEPWYDPDYRVTLAGELWIWKPKLVLADSIVYNAVAQTFLPPDSNLLGIDAARMPPDGKALIFNTGRLVLVHHTAATSAQTLSPDQVVDCERVRLYRAVVNDSLGARVSPSQYAVDRVTGTVTMAPTFSAIGFTPPWSVLHTVADLARLISVDINGTLSFQRALSHDYPAGDSRVSGVLFVGTLQARYTHLFAQATWDGVWADELRGSEPLAQYNDTLYPVGVSNAGAYTDRFLIKFTSSSAFQVIGENLGLIAVGDVNTDCSPTNSLTGQPYFTLDYRGWGAGWATGNCLRFNLIGAVVPVVLVRAVQPSTPSGLSDSIELLFVGNVDA